MDKATKHVWILGQSLLLVGVLSFGCDRSSPNLPEPAREVESTPHSQALPATIAPSTAAATPSPNTPGTVSLDEFKQALLYKVDRSRLSGPKAHRLASPRPAMPEGPILEMPDGQGVHATVVVKDPDGTVRTECVSSSAEVSALVEEIRKGRAR
jgi:hypothetical protein